MTSPNMALATRAKAMLVELVGRQLRTSYRDIDADEI